jgi:hypothetical protein
VTPEDVLLPQLSKVHPALEVVKVQGAEAYTTIARVRYHRSAAACSVGAESEESLATGGGASLRSGDDATRTIGGPR